MSIDERKANRQRKLDARQVWKAYRQGRKTSGMSDMMFQSALSRASKNTPRT